MKVLKQGRIQDGWSTEATCTGDGNGGGGCGAQLFVEQPDLYLTYRHCRNETTKYVTFTCSACGVETDLGERWEVSCPGQLPDKHKHRLYEIIAR